MKKRAEIAALKKQAAIKLREGGFRNRDIALLFDVSAAYVSILLRGSPKPSFPFVIIEDAAPREYPKRENDPRVQRMVELYKSGKTLEEIGNDFGVTRERIRQLIRPFVGRNGGGACVVAQADAMKRKELKRVWREEKCMRMFGCDYETALSLNRGMSPAHNNNSLAAQYLDQKRTMLGAYVNVEYSLTFAQWLEAWGDKLPLRGQGKWGLCRIDPNKGFIAGNVQAMEIKEKARATITKTRARMEQIRSLREAGLSNAHIANQLGLSEGYLAGLQVYGRRMIA